MIDNINRFFVKADNICDYIPVVSTASNFVDLFQKCVVLPFMNAHAVVGSRYYTHLAHKSAVRCLGLLIPVIGNIAAGIFDYINKRSRDEVAILNAIERGDFTGFCVHPTLKMNKEFVLEAVRCNCQVFEHVDPNLRADIDVAYEAVLRAGSLIEHASEELRNNGKLVLAGVPSSNGYALHFASDALKNDKTFMLDAVQLNPFAGQYASEALRKDDDICNVALSHPSLTYNEVKRGNGWFC